MTREEAYAHCGDVARSEARNFYFGFVLLPPERRDGIYAAYAFSRRADDASTATSPSAERLAAVAALRGELDLCAAGTPPPGDPVLVALADTMRRFAIPRAHFDALIDGVEMDLTVTRYADWPALRVYCDRVAGAVGLVSLHVFGFRDPARAGLRGGARGGAAGRQHHARRRRGRRARPRLPAARTRWRPTG